MIYDAITDALALAGDAASCILIGWDAWTQLKCDPRSIHGISLIDDELFFKGVRIDPFSELVQPRSWELI